MSEKIVQFNEEIIKGQIKELVRGSVEETLNGLLEAEAEKLTQAARYERNEARIIQSVRERAKSQTRKRMGIENEAGMHQLFSALQALCDLSGGKSLPDPVARVQNQMADACGQIAGIHRVDARKLLCRKHTVLVGA